MNLAYILNIWLSIWFKSFTCSDGFIPTLFIHGNRSYKGINDNKYFRKIIFLQTIVTRNLRHFALQRALSIKHSRSWISHQKTNLPQSLFDLYLNKISHQARLATKNHNNNNHSPIFSCSNMTNMKPVRVLHFYRFTALLPFREY